MDLILTHESNNLRLPSRLNNNPTITIRASQFSGCDCTSYFYFLLSISLVVLGTFITITALGGSHNTLFSNLGHMWSVGPICVCCGIMMAIKSLLYLRSKRELQMLSFPERAISLMLFRMEEDRRLRLLEELRRAEAVPYNEHHVYALVEDIIVQRHNLSSHPRPNSIDIEALDQNGLLPSSVTVPLTLRSHPPSYEIAVLPTTPSGSSSAEVPPPSYEEAIALIAAQQQQRKLIEADNTTSSTPPTTVITSNELQIPA